MAFLHSDAARMEARRREADEYTHGRGYTIIRRGLVVEAYYRFQLMFRSIADTVGDADKAYMECGEMMDTVVTHPKS